MFLIIHCYRLQDVTLYSEMLVSHTLYSCDSLKCLTLNPYAYTTSDVLHSKMEWPYVSDHMFHLQNFSTNSNGILVLWICSRTYRKNLILIRIDQNT